MKVQKITFIFFLLVAFTYSCSQHPEFSVAGNIENAGGDTIYFERHGFDKINVLDSVVINPDGSFMFCSPSPEYPDLYLLRLGNQRINLSVDSIETLTITASKGGFASDYKVEGSENSQRLKQVVILRSTLQSDIEKLKDRYSGGVVTEKEFQEKLQDIIGDYKEKIKKLILSNLRSPTAYFALFQKYDDILIFNPYQKEDSRMYSAVATAWDTYYKETPRAKYLRDFTISAIKERKAMEQKASLFDNLKVTENADFYNVSLPDVYDKMLSTQSLKGKVILLDFTAYQAEYSPHHNQYINGLYEKYKDKLEVYQISFDADAHFWKNAASNLPWKCVREAKLTDSPLLKRFNIQMLPTTFLMNEKGELVKRLSVGDNIEVEAKKLF